MDKLSANEKVALETEIKQIRESAIPPNYSPYQLKRMEEIRKKLGWKSWRGK